jgi:hypothetical protein
MNKIIILTVGLTLGALQLFGQAKSCERCDVDVVAEVSANLDDIAPDTFYRFLCSFHESCSTNVEYSEFSNEMLFKLLERYPQEFIHCMKRRPIQREYIYDRLSQPLVYETNHQLRMKVSAASGNVKIKNSILAALDKGFVSSSE